MKSFLSVVGFVVGFAACVSAQPRPGAFTTLVTTNTGVTSVCVGGNVPAAPATCLGGLQAGATVVNQAITMPSFAPGVTTNKLYNSGGTLFWAGVPVSVGNAVGPGTINTIAMFTGANAVNDSLITQAGTVITIAGTLLSTVQGTSSFTTGAAGGEVVTVRNTAAGVGNYGRIAALSDVVEGSFTSFSSIFTVSGAQRPNTSLLTTDGTAGLSIQASQAAGVIRFYTGGSTERGQITAAGLWDWETFGAHQFSAGGVGFNALAITNPTAGAGNGATVSANSDTVLGQLTSFASSFTTSGSAVQASTRLLGSGAGGISIDASQAAGTVRIYTGSSGLRATFDAAGNFNLGSTNIMDSPAVPTITSGFAVTPTIAGRNTGFLITTGTANGTNTGVVAFNTTYTNPPVCIALYQAALPLQLAITTTTITFTLAGGNWLTAQPINVICRGR